MKKYMCIDLKSFYASVECVYAKLDPFKVSLVVADESRGVGAITLAITPHLKSLGVKNRCRLFEIPKNIPYIIKKPRMKLYMDYSLQIYKVYLKYFSHEDIHVYSIDEVFIDITGYLNLYDKTEEQLAMMVIKDIYITTGITATCGIGTNLYLAKIALDILAKHEKSNIAYLDIEKYKEKLFDHRPITDFWQVGKGISERLKKYGIYTMRELSTFNEELLYKEFGVNAEFLIDHSKGIEPCTIKDIKNYKPKSNSISLGQILFEDYTVINALVILKEMTDDLLLKLVADSKLAGGVALTIGYSKEYGKKVSAGHKLANNTDSYDLLIKELEYIYYKIVDKNELIRQINISFFNLSDRGMEQLDLFTNNDSNKLNSTINTLKNKYGKNIVLRAISSTKEGNQKNRNKLLGGHNAE